MQRVKGYRRGELPQKSYIHDEILLFFIVIVRNCLIWYNKRVMQIMQSRLEERQKCADDGWIMNIEIDEMK